MNNTLKSYCKNCEETLVGDFCNNCGQRASIGKVTFNETFQDFMDMVFSINAPLMLTLKMLVVNPGRLFREYLDGKRKKYYKPVAFLILTTIIFVIIRSLINYDPMEGIARIQGLDTTTVNLVNEASQFFSKNGNNIVFILVFTLSLSLKLFFFRRYLFSEFIAISFYIIGFYTLMTTVLTFYLKFFNPELRMIPFLFLLIYILFAVTSFFKSINFIVIMKALLTGIISILLYIILGFGLSFLIVWLKTL